MKKFLSIILAFFFGLAVNINAATLTVTKIADTDDGVCNADCSLREAISAAGSGDLIVFSSLFDSAQSIDLFLNELNVNKNVTIRGKGANLLTIRGDEPNGQRVFNIPSGFTVTLSGMTIREGSKNFGFGGGISNSGNLTVSACHITANSAGKGGGISNGGTINIINSTISNNTAVDSSAGGGIFNFGTLTMTNSTVSGNTANAGNFSAGGILNDFNSPALITNSTITGNSANVGVSSAGGVGDDNGTTTLRNSIVAGNNGTNPDVFSFNSFITGGYNLIGKNNGASGSFPAGNPNANNDIVGTSGSPINPLLDALGNYGGTTPTHRLQATSPAIDKGKSFGSTGDQRSFERPFDDDTIPPASGGDDADIGAFEISNFPRVTTTANLDTGSLRQAIADVSAGGTITFDAVLFNVPQTITLESELTIAKNLTITGTGADKITISGNNASRVFNVNGAFTVNFNQITIANGNVPTGDGGGVLNQNGANLTLTNCVVNANTALRGGGIRNVNSNLHIINSTISGNIAAGANNTAGGIESFRDNNVVTTDLEVINSTVSGNSALGNPANAGGILVRSVTFFADNFTPQAASALISNSTIANNSVTAGLSGVGGGIRRGSSTTITVQSTIVAANVNNTNVPDVSADSDAGFTSNGFNLIGNRGIITAFNQPNDQVGTSAVVYNPRLDPLANYGGTTPTHQLQPGSRAIDAGNSFGLPVDQRGFARIFDSPSVPNIGDAADIGAFEVQVPTSASATISGRIMASDGRGIRNALVILTAPNGTIRTTRTSAFGYYFFSEIGVGQTYIISVNSKRFQFTPRTIFLTEDFTELNFVASE